MEQPRTLTIPASLFDCAFCRKSLKPPTFKCDAGHVVCRDCCDGHLQVCSDAVNKSCCIPCPEMDRLVRAAMVSCVHKDRGCTARVPHDESADHLRSCDFVPCKCPLCRFRASPAALPKHFSERHPCHVVHNYVYGQACTLPVIVKQAFPILPPDYPEPFRVAALVGESDGRLFVVHASSSDEGTAVWVVCLRASEDAPAVARQFRCQLWLKGKGTVFSFRVPSSDGKRLQDKKTDLFLTVPRSKAAFTIRIDKGGDEAGEGDEDGGSGDEAAGSSSTDEDGGSDDEASSSDEDMHA